MSKKVSLSNVIGSIQSNKSRAVPKEQTFTPPEPVAKQTPQDLNIAYPQDEKITGDSFGTGDANVTPEPLISGDAQSTEGEKSTQDANSPQGEIVTPSQKTRVTPEEKLALTLKKLKKGFTRLPNCILMAIVFGDHSKAEIKILLLIARYTLSFDERKTASLSKADIERYTRLQGKSILEALTSLLEKNLIIKIKGDQYTANQLGLVYDAETFETPTLKKQPEPKQSDSSKSENSTGVKNSPPDQKVTTPEGTKGTHPADLKSTYFKESSSNDSSLSYKFPEDMNARWKNFESVGKFSNSKKEREIFKNLFAAHGEEFFENCGKVVTFLEERGNGKTGEAGKIHSPMVWIDGHWERNFSQYKTWTLEQEALVTAHKLKSDQDATAKARQETEEQEQKQRQAHADADTERFLSIYATEIAVNSFVEEVVKLSGCEYTQNAWKKLGWESPVVKSCAIAHFLKIEGNRLSDQTSVDRAQASA